MPRPPLARRLQTASRLALYTSMGVVLLIAWGLVATLDRPLATEDSERWYFVDYAHIPAVELLQKYVQIDTSRQTGNEVAGARFLAAQLNAAGIPAEIEVIGGRYANLYARLDGQDPHPLVLHNHIDVADVVPSEWVHPPFSGLIDLPRIWGRGVFDMKSVAIAEMLALIDLKQSGRPLRRSVLFLATGGEEADDSRLGARWVIAEHPQLVSSFWAVLTEGGTVEARSRSDVKYWGTEIGQKNFAKVHVCSSSRERLEALRDTLHERGYTTTDLQVLPAIGEVLRRYGPSRDDSRMRDALAHPEDLTWDHDGFRALPGYVQAMVRNEVVPFDVVPAAGGGWELLIMVQLLPGTRFAAVRDELLPPWMMQGLDVTVDEATPGAMPSPTDHPVFREILATLRTDFPNFPAGPFFLPATITDARFFRAAGIPSYGFSPFLIMSSDTYQVDRSNERLSLEGYVQGVDLYRKLLRRLVL
jgi:acetylornithine deacetylase/succinyl-diaminopimelate desuccinylase-like protein